MSLSKTLDRGMRSPRTEAIELSAQQESDY
jgi:hypothetical protein